MYWICGHPVYCETAFVQRIYKTCCQNIFPINTQFFFSSLGPFSYGCLTTLTADHNTVLLLLHQTQDVYVNHILKRSANILMYQLFVYVCMYVFSWFFRPLMCVLDGNFLASCNVFKKQSVLEGINKEGGRGCLRRRFAHSQRRRWEIKWDRYERKYSVCWSVTVEKPNVEKGWKAEQTGSRQ